ncbi:aspartyl-phosphate phosphatase Spo0E family protein [Virgibacillus sp. C22-A2]|uniref:Aspartyl-phosphate phosphatase Spo0E family protein n=1 Tax=Virgibacillus tibetensis TaxID=3042313 RepID=A0ABU6KKU1_9BACI|nr:aspartyl-phosphate phosphatase Spo0E family protein [Virgibacillus sp. C22-A2]
MSIEMEVNQSELAAAILIKKREMVELGMTYGLLDERTIKCSQQLDDLLNKHLHIKRRKLCFN